MDFLEKDDFIKDKNKEIQVIYDNLKREGNLQLEIFYSNANNKSEKNILYICKIIIIYLKLLSFKNKRILRNINYINYKVIYDKNQKKNNIYKLSNKKYSRNLLFLFYIILYNYQIYIQNNIKIEPKEKYKLYQLIKQIYKLLKNISIIISKFYFDKIINIEDLEIILKMLILFSINNNSDLDIKKNNDLENIMYLKECLNIIKIIFNKENTKEEEKLLIVIFKYIIKNIFYIDNNNQNLNYTNKFYMINNDHKTTKLLSLMNFIYKINNDELSNIYFELLSNVYSFQFNYNTFNWPFYKLLEPLLVNIEKKNYSEILKEVSFPKFQINLLKYIINKENSYIKKYPCILSNGFYFGENNKNSGIIAEMDKFDDNNFIITFGFKLMVRDEKPEQKEYIILQFKSSNDLKTQFRISILKQKNVYLLVLYENKSKEKKKYF